MDIKDFKLIKNRQRPDWCYAYEMYSQSRDKKFSIFTMNGGADFLASITGLNGLGKLVVNKFSKECKSVDQALKAIIEAQEQNQ